LCVFNSKIDTKLCKLARRLEAKRRKKRLGQGLCVRSFPQSLQKKSVNCRLQIQPRTFPSTSITFHNSLNTQPFQAALTTDTCIK